MGGDKKLLGMSELRKDRKGKEGKGRERKGTEGTGKERKGKEGKERESRTRNLTRNGYAVTQNTFLQ